MLRRKGNFNYVIKVRGEKVDRCQFDILEFFVQNHPFLSLEELSKKIGLPLETVKNVRSVLEEKGLLQNNKITDLGRKALEPYKAKRAILFAAGLGSRLLPVTQNIPKPLVRVNGTRLIDTLIDAVLAAGIEEIIVVRGYHSEQFDQLLGKYPNLKFVDNPFFETQNNISSAMCVRDLFESAYVMDGDLLLYNPKLIKPYQYESNYLGIPVDKTDDWCLTTQNGYIKSMVIGGERCYTMVGVSFWSPEDGKRLANHLKVIYDRKDGKQCFWDQVALDFFQDQYKIRVRSCSSWDIAEIDTLVDLKKVDCSYA